MKTETKDQLRAKIENLEERNANLIKAHGRMRGEIVEANQKLHECQAADPEFADKYKVVDPENAYWMENAEALIEISTGYMFDAEPVRKRVCTIPIPLLINDWRNSRRKRCATAKGVVGKFWQGLSACAIDHRVVLQRWRLA